MPAQLGMATESPFPYTSAAFPSIGLCMRSRSAENSRPDKFPMTSSPTSSTVSWRSLVFLAVGIGLLLPGCVRRRLMVRSNPPGAMVYVDNQPIGTTPCATDFVYYGTREIRLVKPGYETLTVTQPIPAPWYEIPPLDFISENLVPRKIQDYRTVSFNMAPQVIVPTEQLLGRAEQLRQNTLQGAVLPTGATTPIVPANPGGFPAGAPTLATPNSLPNFRSPENISPGQIVPQTPGTGTLPWGGQILEPLPAPTR